MTQHPTIRAIAGASAPKSLDPRKTALVVIDFQNEYFTGKMPIPDGKKALTVEPQQVVLVPSESTDGRFGF